MPLIPFGEFIEAVRLRRHPRLSQRQVARKLGYSPGYLSMIESGDRPPSLKFIRRAASRFKIPELYLLTFCPALEEKERENSLRALLRRRPSKFLGFGGITEKMEVETFREALQDPDLLSSRRFRKASPRIPSHLRALIVELYRNWNIERELRERLEEEYTGQVTPRYQRRRTKYEEPPEPDWRKEERLKHRAEVEERVARMQKIVMDNLDKILELGS